MSETGRDHLHSYFRVEFHALEPSTTYTVEIASQSDTSPVTFRTLGPPPGELRFRIALLSDLHIQPGASKIHSQGPRRRLYEHAEELGRKYIARMGEQADLVVWLGDTFDPFTAKLKTLAKELVGKAGVPCVPIIGNHEIYGELGEADFYRAFDLPAHGYHRIDRDGLRLIFLSTPDQACLSPGDESFDWLARELDTEQDVLVFSHFSLLLHPCVRGPKNDGMQVLYRPQAVLDLLRNFPNVRAFVAGHKNVPSRVEHDGVLHLLTPQLIQAPCSYTILSVHERGLVHNVYEIEEQELAQRSRDAYGRDYAERHGPEDARNYNYVYPKIYDRA
ncbi:MAG: metallophosphoesterase [Planctomycetota bacterium]